MAALGTKTTRGANLNGIAIDVFTLLMCAAVIAAYGLYLRRAVYHCELIA